MNINNQSFFYKKHIIFLIITLLIGCTVKNNSKGIDAEKGFNLQKFVIINKELQTVVNDITKGINLDRPAEVLTLTLELRKYKSNLEFWFYLVKKEEVTYRIFSHNQRIVGYLTDNEKDVLVLSDIDNRFDFEFIFYKFIQPTDTNKRFNFVYFDENQYQVDEQGGGFPPHDVIAPCVAYVFQDNKMVKMEDEQWYYDRIMK